MTKKPLTRILVFAATILFFACSSSNSTSADIYSRIAYTYYSAETGNKGEVYSVCADGSDATRLTDDPAYDGAPAWSPDGTQLAFVSDRSGIAQVYRMDANGDNVRQLTTDLQNDQPVWLPGGGRSRSVLRMGRDCGGGGSLT